MTRETLYDWITAYNCEIEELPEINNTARCLRFKNPATNGRAYINTPIDDTEVYDYAACQICTQLGIPIPDCLTEHTPLIKHIQEKHGKK